MPLLTILETYTENQLRLIAIASLVQYKNMKHEMDTDKPGNKSALDEPKKKKSFKNMTKKEIDEYYSSSGSPI